MLEIQPLYVFDQDDRLLTSLSVFHAPYLTEEKGRNPIFEFEAPINVDEIEYLKEEHHVVVKDNEGVFRLFIIKELDKSLHSIKAYCVSGMQELADKLIDDKRPQDVSASNALSSALSDTRYAVGQVASLGNNSTSFYHIYVTEALDQIVNTWGGEIRDRVEFDENGITGRYIDLLTRHGSDRGHRFEIGKDIKGVNIRIQSYPKTALYGWGSAIEYDSGGYSRKVDFADVEWIVANGDPVDKPLGQTWVGDPDALEKWGRLKDGQRIHREGKVDLFEIDDPEELLMQTWLALQEQKDPNINVQMDVVLLGELVEFSHKKVRFGDTVRARIKELDFTAEMRVIKHRYNVLDYSDAEVEIGQPLRTNNNSSRLKKVESQLADQPTTPTVNDDSFPDTVPNVPGNFTATGSFKLIMLSWDYDPSSYIAAYEIYASQVQGFTPDSSNLVWRGKSGGYNHRADVNEQWYFKIRAVNTHGTPSDFSAEISAQTLQINADTEVTEETITKKLLARKAILDSIHVGEGVINDLHFDRATANKIQIKSADIVELKAEKIIGGDFTGKTFTGGTFSGSIFEAEDASNYVEVKPSRFYSYEKVSSGDYHSASIQSGEIRLDYGTESLKSYINLSPTDFETYNTSFKLTNAGIEFYGGTDLRAEFHTYSFNGLNHLELDAQVFKFIGTRIETTSIDADSLNIFGSAYVSGTIDARGSQNAILFDGGDARITVHDGTGNFNIKSGLDNNNNAVAGNGGSRIRMDDSGGIWLTSYTGSTPTVANEIQISNVDIEFFGNVDMNGHNIYGGGTLNMALNHNSGYMKFEPYNSNYDDGTYGRVFYSGNDRYLSWSVSNGTGIEHIASAFTTSSVEEGKEEISEWQDSVLGMFRDKTQMKLYTWVNKGDENKLVNHGFVIGEGYETPDLLIGKSKKGISGYEHSSFNTKAIQELVQEVDFLKAEVEELKSAG